MRPRIAVLVRLLAFVGKEVIETLRRPGALVSLILGPFLIMAVFGIGYNGEKRPLETIVVAPPDSGLPTDVATYQGLAGGGLHIAQVTSDRDASLAQIADGAVDVVVLVPEHAQDQFKAGQQTVVQVVIDDVDPVEATYTGFLASLLSSAVNREIVRRVAEAGQAYAVAAGDTAAARIPPDVVAEPTRAEVVNTAPSQPGVVAFFAPAVLALILQHLAVTLVALSLVRERTSGVMELFRVAPVSPAEILLGKILAFGLIGTAIAALSLGLLVGGLHVPALAGPAPLVLTIGLLLVASLCVGLLIAVVSDSERQAVQLSLLILLASMFFSGFVLSIDQFSPIVRDLAYGLPVTHGIRLLQDLMLRGTTTNGWEWGALVAIGAVSLFASWILLRRTMQRG